MSNIKRLWVVVNTCTSEVIYSSFDYSRAKKVYDLQFVPFEKSLPEDQVDADMMMYHTRPVDYFPVDLLRYDLCRHYDSPSVFQKSLNDDLRAFLDFCLLRKSGEKKNNEEKTILQKTDMKKQEEK